MRNVRAEAVSLGAGLLAVLALVACGGTTTGAKQDGHPDAGVSGGAGGRGGAGGAGAGTDPGLVVASDGSRWDCITHYELNPIGPRATDCRCLPLGPTDPAPGCRADSPEGTCVSGQCTYTDGCCVFGHPSLPDGCRCFAPGDLGLDGCEGFATEGRVSACPGDTAFTEVNVCQGRPPREPGILLPTGSPCCPRAGVDWGICKSAFDLSEDVREMIGFEGCNAFAGDVCVPSLETLAAHASTALVSCSTDLGNGQLLEGRCLPDCLVTAVTAMGHFEQGECAEGLVCATCYDAVDGRPTKACTFAPGDAPVSAPPPPLSPCGGTPVLGQDYCAPEKWNRGGLSSILPRLTCAEGEVCTPGLKTLDPYWCFQACIAGGVVADREGRYRWGSCVPLFVASAVSVDVAAFERDICAPGDLCVPCIDPFSASGEEKTGVCD